MEHCPPLKTCGIWIRPDAEEHGCSYEKLYADGVYDRAHVSWATVKPSINDMTKPSHVLTYNKLDKFWRMYEASAPLDIYALREEPNMSKKMFVLPSVKSFIEPLETRDLVWSRLARIEDVFEPAKASCSIVWRARKMWSNDTRYASSITAESEMWLDKLEVLDDGSCKWSSADGSYIMRRPSESGLPYETTHWTVFLPSMFEFPTEALALHNAEDMLASYVDNSPLKVKYVYVQAFSKKLYEQSKFAWEIEDGHPRAELGENPRWVPRDFEVPFGPALDM